MSCCAAGTNECLDLRRRTSADVVHALDGQVSAERSRCPGSMARRAWDIVAPLQRSSAGWMPAKIWRLTTGAGCRHPVTIHKASLMAGSMGWYEQCGTRQERSTLRLNAPGLGWLIPTLLLQHPKQIQQAASGVRHVISASCEVAPGVGDT